MKIKPTHIVIAVLLALLVFLQQCGGKLNLISKGINTQYEEVIKTDTVVKEITTTDTVTTYQPKLVYVYRDTGSIDTLIRNLPPEAELAALRDYFTQKVYRDTLTGENYTVYITDTLEQNSLFARSYYANITNTEKTITIEKTVNKFKFYVGAGLTYNVESQFDISPTIGFAPRNDMYFYSMSYNVLNRGVTATVLFKLRFK